MIRTQNFQTKMAKIILNAKKVLGFLHLARLSDISLELYTL